MRRLRNYFKSELINGRADESGMEAAQVILILVLVVLVLIPVIANITSALSRRGDDVIDGINKV